MTKRELRESTEKSFRPLAGFWFLNYGFGELYTKDNVFPSPCGVLVLKFARAIARGVTDYA